MSTAATSRTGAPQGAPASSPLVRRYAPPDALRERITAMVMRTALRLTLKPYLGPPWPFAVQRGALALGSSLMPQDGRARVQADRVDHIPVERVSPKAGGKPRQAILYLHGGAFVAGSPRTHRSITRRLSALTGALVLVPHYRLAPEHAFPAGLDDCVRCYQQLLQEGYTADRIAIAGDPMIRLAWGASVEKAMAVPPDHPLANPLAQDLSALPPSLTQVGDDEVLYDNAVWVQQAATAAGRLAELEVYEHRWHVFQAHAGLMRSSDEALARQAAFMKRHWAA
jgi:monoterpene epsilon-lactone hydrolase